jgi:predicted permease
MVRALRKLLDRLRHTVRDAPHDPEFQAEIDEHVRLLAERYCRQGLMPAAAMQAARRQFGNATLLREERRDVRTLPAIDALRGDLIFAARMLRTNPGFAAAAIVTLALGIGANTTIFGLIDALILKSLPVRDPQSLLFIAKQAQGGVDPAFYYETYERLRAEQSFFREVAAFGERVRMNVSVDGGSESLMGQLVSGNYYTVLGVPPAAGRVFTGADDRVPGGHPVAVISYSYWQRRFAREGAAIGSKILIDGTPFTIVGVTPPGFFGLQVGDAPDISVPIMMQPQLMPDRESWLGRSRNTVDWLMLFGRLKPGVTIPHATSGLQVVFHRIQSQLAEEIGLGKATWRQEWVEARIVLVPGGAGLSHLRRQYSGALFVLMAVAGTVLLIACVNIASLLLVRAAARQREIALRLAIGATRARVIRQLLVESLMLSAPGGALGIMFSFAAGDLLVRFLSAGRPLIHLDLALDWRVLAFTIAVSMATALLFGMAPAMRGAALDLGAALRQGGRGSSPPQRLARALSAAQLALSLVLLTGAGLLAGTLRHLDRMDGDFPRDRVYTVSLSPRGSDQKNGPNGPRLNRMYLDLLERARAIPGVAAASLAGEGPSMMGLPSRPFTAQDGRQFTAYWDQIYPGYFAAMGSAVLHGRDLVPADMQEGAPLVTIINETLARRVFPGQDPVGRRIVCTGRISMAEAGSPCEVIGVVRDVPYSRRMGEPENTMYMTFLESPTGRGQMELIVRTAGAADIAAQLRHEVTAMDPYLPGFPIRTLATIVDAALVRERLLALISTVFAALASLLAAIGLYGVVAYSVSRRTQEIGVRMALGALPGRVQRLVLRESLTLVALGIVCGLPVASAAARSLSTFLHGVKPGDPIVLVSSVGLLAAAAAIAGYIPARRAARIDPVEALRQE